MRSVVVGSLAGETRRLRGRGVKHLRANGCGDQYIQFKVIIPSAEDLTPDQAELVQKYGDERSESDTQTRMVRFTKLSKRIKDHSK